jgi:ParB family chromosome partitioning protein
MQLEALRRIKENNLSVRKVEQLVKNLMNPSEVRKKSVTSTVRTTASAEMRNIEDRLQKIFGTKVSCKQKQNGSGEIQIEFYSTDELERLFELFEIINKNFS